MALKAGSVLTLPDLACIGLVNKVGDAYLSEKGVYHVIPIEIKAKFAGRDGVFFLVFEPRWFGASFDPKELLAEEPRKPVKYGMYCRTCAGEARPSLLANILGDKFEAFAGEFDNLDNPTADDVAEIFRTYAAGQDVGYIMAQRKDEDGKPMEQYNIQRFFDISDAGLAEITRQAQSEKRKTPLVITWDE